MIKETVSGIELTIKDPNEIMGMGGPYVADIYIGEKLISNDCIAGNFVFKEDSRLLFFVKHHLVGYYHYFTINFYKVDDGTVCQFSKEFDMVYIKQFIGPNELEIFHAFHDESMSSRLVFNLNDEDFEQV